MHYIDFIQWALGEQAPVSVTALGGKPARLNDNRQIPDTLEAVWQYPGGTLVTFSQFNASAAQWSLPGCELEIRGTLGTLYMLGDRYEIVADSISEDEFPARTPLTRQQDSRYRRNGKPRIESRKAGGGSAGDTVAHARNFLDCIRTRKLTASHPELAQRAHTICHCANIALRLGRKITWDPVHERFVGDDDANRMISRAMRAPWRV